MAYRPKDIYRGRRRFRVVITVILSVLAALILALVLAFNILQQFVVYESDGVSRQVPSAASATEDEEAATVTATPAPTFERVEGEVIYEAEDFSDTDLGGWEELTSTQALYIPMEDVTSVTSLATAVTKAQAGSYTGVVMQMKDATGRLAWDSQTDIALGYNTGGSTDVTETIAQLHELGLTVAAQISCCADTLLGTRNWTVTLQDATGGTYTDDDGVVWLDPYNRTVRSYLIGLIEELIEMGFDEIILADLYHPIVGEDETIGYSTTLYTDASPVTAICLLGQHLVEAAEGTGTAVSVLLDASSLRNGYGELTGQDIGIFWRLFARLYCPTNSANITSDKELATATLTAGSADIRFVAVCSSVPEDCESYVIS